MKRIRIKELTKIALFSALLVICSWISIPFWPVSFTMQSFALFLAAALLGAKKSVLVVLLYTALGVLGLPVFSGGQAGVGVLFGPTGGYIAGFFVASLISGKLAERSKKSIASLYAAMFLGLLLIYVSGIIWYLILYLPKGMESSFWGVISTLVLPFLVPDILKITLSVFVARRIERHIK